MKKEKEKLATVSDIVWVLMKHLNFSRQL